MRVGRQPRSNPFSTRFVRPGAIPFCFPQGEGAGTLVTRLERQGWWGQIVGPHGSGKSTLLAQLRPHLEAAGCEVVVVVRRRGERSLPPGFWVFPQETRSTSVLAVVCAFLLPLRLSYGCRNCRYRV